MDYQKNLTYIMNEIANKKHILITGDKDVGKSWLFNDVLNNIENYGGIITKAIRDEKFFPKHIIIYDALDESSSSILAVRNETADGLVPNINAFNGFAVDVLQKCRKSNTYYIVIDELGFLETSAEDFKSEVLSCFNQKQVIAVIRRGNTDFLNSIKELDNTILIDLN